MTADTPDITALRAGMRAKAEKAHEDWLRVDARGEKLWGSHEVISGFHHVASPANIIAVLDADAAEIARLTVERDEARGAVAFLVDKSVFGDSYGVIGSDFQCCHFCMGGGAPNVEFKHDADCPVLRYEAEAAEWWQEKAEDAARAAAEARVKVLEEALQRFVYETTCLSPEEDDGSHWCKISAECLAKGRAARLTGAETTGDREGGR